MARSAGPAGGTRARPRVRTGNVPPTSAAAACAHRDRRCPRPAPRRVKPGPHPSRPRQARRRCGCARHHDAAARTAARDPTPRRVPGEPHGRDGPPAAIAIRRRTGGDVGACRRTVRAAHRSAADRVDTPGATGRRPRPATAGRARTSARAGPPAGRAAKHLSTGARRCRPAAPAAHAACGPGAAGTGRRARAREPAAPRTRRPAGTRRAASIPYAHAASIPYAHAASIPYARAASIPYVRACALRAREAGRHQASRPVAAAPRAAGGRLGERGG